MHILIQQLKNLSASASMTIPQKNISSLTYKRTYTHTHLLRTKRTMSKKAINFYDV